MAGLAHPLTSQQLSLVAFLACVGPAGRDAVVEAVWGGRPVTPARFANVVSATRARLGAAHLPAARMGRYRLVDVSVDLHTLAMADGGRGPIGEEAIARLESIRGPILDRPGSRYWSWLDDRPELVAAAEALVGRIAARSVRSLAAAGRLDRATTVCERALAGCPLDRELVGLLADLHHAQGRTGAAGRLADRWRSRVGMPPTGRSGQMPTGSAVTTWLPT